MTTDPYLALKEFEPDHFYGREIELKSVLEFISSSSLRIVLIEGLYEIGKSSFLRYLAHPGGALHTHSHFLHEPFLNEPWRLLPIFVDFLLLPGDVHPFDYLYESFLNEYKRHELVRSRTNLPGFPGLDAALDVDEPEGMISLLEKHFRKLAEHGFRPVLLLDGFDVAFERLTKVQTNRMVPLRKSASFILAAERPLHQVNAEAYGSPFYQKLDFRSLGSLSHDESSQLITKTAGELGVSFAEEDVRFLIEETGGHPYLLILAGSVLLDVSRRIGSPDDNPTPITQEHTQYIRARLQEVCKRSFQLYWEQLELEDRDALRGVLNPASLSEAQRKRLASLEDKGLIDYDLKTKRYNIFSPLFAEFIRNTASENTFSVYRLDLTGLEANLYDYLRRHPNKICTFDELWQEVWASSSHEADLGQDSIRRRMQVTVSRLRKKIQDAAGEDIIGVREQGYRFIPKVSG